MNKRLIIAYEISWLSFNARVLQEAEDPSVPLKNRIRFLGIYSNNRDEFFRRRIGALKHLIPPQEQESYISKKFSKQVLESLYPIILKQQEDFNRIWEKVNDELIKQKIFIRDDKSLNARQKKFVIDYFVQEVNSSIIPFIDTMPNLPSYGDENIFIGIVMKKNATSRYHKFAIIEIPTKNHPRFIFLPGLKGEQNVLLLEDVIRVNLPQIFSNLEYSYFESYMFKITKDSEIKIDNTSVTPFIQKIETGLKNRRKGQVISFLYDKDMNKKLLGFLLQKLNLSSQNIIIPGGKIRNFSDFMHFPVKFTQTQSKRLSFKHPDFAHSKKLSNVILKKDILLNFPFHSFNTLIDLLCEAAIDSEVKSIKITAYRLADHSKICNALINAARMGKKVHVILELRAYFDEQANLDWKKKLEEEGVKVFLGSPEIKVHAKICVIQKEVNKKNIYYGFVGTGNLNEKTALSYTDLFLLTSRHDIMADINRIFLALEDPVRKWHQLKMCKTLLVSPINMRQTLSTMIHREITLAKSGKPAKIILNLNSLSDEHLIKQLYLAAEVGVEIKMIIRGIFSLETSRNAFTSPISAISIVDEYLEHSRIWLFNNNGNEDMYISSSDWKKGNLDHRLEVAVPIYDPIIKNELIHILKIKLSDNVKARRLDNAFSNQYISSDRKKKVRSQLAIYNYLKRKKSKK